MATRGKLGRPVQWRLPLIITLGYLIFGVVWITVSDALVLRAVETQHQISVVQTYKGWAYVTITAAALFGALVSIITSLVRTREELAQTHIEYTQLVNSINDGVCVYGDPDKPLFVNEAMAEMLGVERADLMKTGLDPYLVHDGRFLSDDDMVSLRRGRPRKVELELRCADGRTIWAHASVDPVFDRTGELVGELCIVSDITERKRAMEALRESNEAQRRLLNELHHRMRNNLASLHSLIDLTRSSEIGLESVLSTLRGRVSAMTTAHELLAQTNWQPLPLEQIVERVVDHEMASRVEAEGPPVLVLPDRVAPLASVLHELMLNAKQHGALRHYTGTVSVQWSLVAGDDGEQLRIGWTERDGGPIDHEPAPGAGLSIVEGLVRSDLRGTLELRFAGEGAAHVLKIPVQDNIRIPSTRPAAGAEA